VRQEPSPGIAFGDSGIQPKCHIALKHAYAAFLEFLPQPAFLYVID